MSCAGKGYGTNPASNGYLTAQFSSMITTTPKSTRNCRKFQGFYPSFNPIIYNLSTIFSYTGEYVVVYVVGANFLPYGSTYIRFGNLQLQVVYFSSENLSFTVPLNANPGVYNVQAVNIYNGNFSPPVNQSYGSQLNYSNIVQYTISAEPPPPPPPPIRYFSVAVGAGTNGNIGYSPDGFNWTPTSTTAFGTGNCVAYNGSIWVAGGDNGSGFAYSTNGIDWATANWPAGFIPQGFGYNESLWIAAGTDGAAGNTLCYSYNGLNWTLLSPITGVPTLNDVECNGTIWVAVGNGYIYYSNGPVWTQANSVAANFNSVAWNGVIWVAGGSAGAVVYSSDGINWSLANASNLINLTITDVAWSGSMWVATGRTAASPLTFAYSYDGINWDVANTDYIFDSQALGVVWAGTFWIAVGLRGSQNNTIAYSYDGQNWYGLGNPAVNAVGNKVATTYMPPLLTPPPPIYYWSVQAGVLCAGYTVVAPQVYSTSVLPTSLTPAPANAWILSGTQLSTTWNVTVLSFSVNPSTTSTISSTNNYWYIDTSTPNTIYTTYPVQVQGVNTVFV